MISGIGKLVVEVDDQERAKEFWTTRMGFELRRDQCHGDQRWIEVSPRDGGPLLVLGGAPAAFAAPPPDPELKRLEPLLGTGRAEGHTRDSVLGPGVPVRSTETSYWLEGGYFLVSTYETTFGGEPTQTGVNYWNYDAEARRFRIIFFSNNGPFSEHGNRYAGVVAGAKLTFEGPARFQYELGDDGAVAVNPDGTIAVAWWLRDQTGDWSPWMHNTFRRVR